jgi:hypothetical protein
MLFSQAHVVKFHKSISYLMFLYFVLQSSKVMENAWNEYAEFEVLKTEENVIPGEEDWSSERESRPQYPSLHIFSSSSYEQVIDLEIHRIWHVGKEYTLHCVDDNGDFICVDSTKPSEKSTSYFTFCNFKKYFDSNCSSFSLENSIKASANMQSPSECTVLDDLTQTWYFELENQTRASFLIQKIEFDFKSKCPVFMIHLEATVQEVGAHHDIDNQAIVQEESSSFHLILLLVGVIFILHVLLKNWMSSKRKKKIRNMTFFPSGYEELHLQKQSTNKFH